MATEQWSQKKHWTSVLLHPKKHARRQVRHTLTQRAKVLKSTLSTSSYLCLAVALPCERAVELQAAIQAEAIEQAAIQAKAIEVLEEEKESLRNVADALQHMVNTKQQELTDLEVVPPCYTCFADVQTMSGISMVCIVCRQSIQIQ